MTGRKALTLRIPCSAAHPFPQGKILTVSSLAAGCATSLRVTTPSVEASAAACGHPEDGAQLCVKPGFPQWPTSYQCGRSSAEHV